MTLNSANLETVAFADPAQGGQIAVITVRKGTTTPVDWPETWLPLGVPAPQGMRIVTSRPGS